MAMIMQACGMNSIVSSDTYQKLLFFTIIYENVLKLFLLLDWLQNTVMVCLIKIMNCLLLLKHITVW